MQNDDIEDKQEHVADGAEAPPVEERDDISFFNPWDRHLNADMKSERNKFEF